MAYLLLCIFLIFQFSIVATFLNPSLDNLEGCVDGEMLMPHVQLMSYHRNESVHCLVEVV